MFTDDLIDYLEEQFPQIIFFNGTIDKNLDKCVGVYPKERLAPIMALGGPECTSFNAKSFSILIHWSENSHQCEQLGTEIYNYLEGKSNITIGDIKIRSIQMLDSNPVFIGRDENNICESVIRVNVFYNR